jgi:hypothetical protein
MLRGWLDFVTLDGQHGADRALSVPRAGRGEGGAQGVLLILHSDRVPSLLGLENWLPRRLRGLPAFAATATGW